MVLWIRSVLGSGIERHRDVTGRDMPNKSKAQLNKERKVLNKRLRAGSLKIPRNLDPTRHGLMAHNHNLEEILIRNGLGERGDMDNAPIEVYNPEVAGEAIAMASEPFTTLKQAGEAAGLNERTVGAIIRRIRSKSPDFHEQIKTLSTQKLIASLNEKIAMVLDFIDPVVLAQASFRDLTIGLGILIEKKQLVSGDPTQIISVDERKTLYAMMPLLFNEANRRGITIEHVPDEAPRTILPSEPTRELLSKTARNPKLFPTEDGSLNA